MSRRTISLLVGFYFLAALSFSFFRVVSSPFFSGLRLVTVGQVIGGGLLLLVVAGLPPLLAWTFYRFNRRYALWPMLSWAFIGIALAFFVEVGVRLERDVQVYTLA
jgi:hypothetical protein